MPLVNPLLSPSDPSNIYSPYPDPTGVPSPSGPKGTPVGLRGISQANYDTLTSVEKAENVLYVIPASA